MKKLFLPLLFIIPVLLQGQGMWLPLLLEKQNEKDMKSKGMKISADDLYNLNKPSIKDAICMFGGGCTGELISGDGLLLTNHHCGFGSIQRLSSLEHNYVEDGYWAKSRDEEIPAPGLTATFVSRIEDVTALALQNVSETMAEADRQSQIDKNLDLLRRTTKREKWEDVMIRPFYDGNQYFLFVTKTYRDLRFVGAPPSSIGKFGADTDNWVWPRHTGDFSMFRVYADKDGHPADYATDNEPYHPAHFLPISLNGVETGDFTMVYGFLGKNQ
ncbi:MAG: S46 family peptidase [Saprospiraceae bacterium]